MTRIATFQSQVKPNQAILLSTANDITYFTLFEFLVPEEREAFLLFTREKAYLIVSAFSPVPESAELTVLRGCYPHSLAKHIQEITTDLHITSLEYQGNSLYVDELEAIKKTSPLITFTSLPARRVWSQRMVKDSKEIEELTTAGQIVAQTLNEVKRYFTVGVTELDITEQISTLFKKYGAEGLGFPTIVAFGEHATSPHHQPDETKLKQNTAILIDCGAKVHGYRSDMTRTWWFGSQKDPDFMEIEQIVKDAYRVVLKQLKKLEGKKITARQLDDLARQFITEAGYGKEFIHTTGHGVGLDIHEPPSLSWSDETVIFPGMVITVEPGIYLEKRFGYRYENTVLITEDGAVELTDDHSITY